MNAFNSPIFDLVVSGVSSSMQFECDQCGACCCSFPIFASRQDVKREPQIAKRALELDPWLGDEQWRYQLHPLPFLNQCPFLAEDRLCSIYQSRPEVCRQFEAGTPQCQEARKRKGLQPLLATSM